MFSPSNVEPVRRSMCEVTMTLSILCTAESPGSTTKSVTENIEVFVLKRFIHSYCFKNYLNNKLL